MIPGPAAQPEALPSTPEELAEAARVALMTSARRLGLARGDVEHYWGLVYERLAVARRGFTGHPAQFRVWAFNVARWTVHTARRSGDLGQRATTHYARGRAIATSPAGDMAGHHTADDSQRARERIIDDRLDGANPFLPSMTEREREIADILIRGGLQQSAAVSLGLSKSNVSQHVSTIRARFTAARRMAERRERPRSPHP